MKERKYGNLQVSEIGLGCMGFSHGYGHIPDEQYSIEAIQAAFSEGCHFFDTAEAYGPNLLPENKGHNEKILGKALQGLKGVSRSDYQIATKLHLPTQEAREKGVYPAIKEHLMASLERLQTDYADLYYLHRINHDIPVEEVAEAMKKLYEEGLIRGWGLSQVDVDIIERAQKVFPLSAVQNIYSMVERGVEKEVIPYCLANNILLVAFSPTSSGLLSGKVHTNTEFEKVDDVRNFVPQLKKENLEKNQPIVDLLNKYAALKNATPVQISLAWMLHKYPNVVPIPGSKNKVRISENLHSADIVFTREEFENLDHELNAIEVYGYRGFSEHQGSTIADWGKR